MPPKKKKTSSKSTQPVRKVEVAEYTSSQNETSPKRLSTRNIVLLLLALAILLYLFKSLFIAATVNGKPISRLAVVKELESQSGKTVLDSLITESLVRGEAAKQHATVSDSEVNNQLDAIKKSVAAQGQDFNQALSAQGLTEEKLRKQIELQKMVEQLFAKDIKVSDKEVQDFVEKNKDNIPEGAKDADVKKQAEEQLRQTKLSEKFQAWVTSAKSKAKINYFVKY